MGEQFFNATSLIARDFSEIKNAEDLLRKDVSLLRQRCSTWDSRLNNTEIRFENMNIDVTTELSGLYTLIAAMDDKIVV